MIIGNKLSPVNYLDKFPPLPADCRPPVSEHGNNKFNYVEIGFTTSILCIILACLLSTRRKIALYVPFF